MKVVTVRESKVSLEAGHVEDIQLASTKMTGADRRAFQAEMALKYCSGKPNRRPKVSCDGIPFSSFRKRRSQSIRSFPHASMPTKSSTPQTMAQTARTSISTRSCFDRPATRGSGIAPKASAIDRLLPVSYTHLTLPTSDLV